MEYEHTQKAPLGWILLAAGAVAAVYVCVLAVLVDPMAAVALAPIIVLFGCLAFCFGSLSVRDEGQYLRVRFGPVPVFGTKIPYAQMTGAEPARSDVLDGWGIHWIPGRGWIYNLWGFDCVRIRLGKKMVRIGTDNVEGLAAFLQTRIRASTGDVCG